MYVTLSGYTLTAGGVVGVKFTYAVPANATLNVNSKGAKSIYYKGKAIVDGVICAGEVATFLFDGTYYHLLTVDRNRFFNSLVPYGTQITASETATVDLNIPEDDGTMIAQNEDASAAIMLELRDTLTNDQASNIAQFIKTSLGNDQIQTITIIDNETIIIKYLFSNSI